MHYLSIMQGQPETQAACCFTPPGACTIIDDLMTVSDRLLFCPAGEDSIKHLLSRGTHREFGYAALVVMLVFYFAGAVWAAGSAIASGLFVPMLLIGSCIGRIAGLIAVDFAAAGGHGSAGYACNSSECSSPQRAPSASGWQL